MFIIDALLVESQICFSSVDLLLVKAKSSDG
nr:MAG TPA: hypothetical protein [Caudoviricetes sp.]